jgi:hypothetical protein
MDKNVMIPLSLFNQICELLGYWDISQYDIAVQFQYFNALRVLDMKRRRLELRDDYAQFIRSDNQDDRDQARVRYLHKKSRLCCDEDDIPF